MILIVAIFITSIGCLIISFLTFFLLLKHLYSKQNDFVNSSSSEAILISGCDSGIGLEIAKYFLKTCKYKIICGFLNFGSSQGHKELSQLAKLSENIGRLKLQKLDITLNQDVSDVTQTIQRMLDDKSINNIVALINNAGTMTYGEFDWLTWDHIQKQIDVNLTGSIRLTRSIIPYLLKCQGRIINVSSVNDATVFPGLSVYSATKSGLSTFSRGLGYELRKFGCKVVLVRLGDFARLTNIMSTHESKCDDMWNEMNNSKKEVYNDFFHQFNKHLLKNYGMTSPKVFEDSSLFRDFEIALLARNPPATITCAPWTFRLFYFMIELTPIWIQYHLLDVLIRFGFQWDPPKVCVKQLVNITKQVERV